MVILRTNSSIRSTTLGIEVKMSSHDVSTLEKVIVLIPDLFTSFLAKPARVNPHYRQVRPEAEAWISQFCSFDEKMSKRISKCDSSYYFAVAAPEANAQRYRTLCDWGNWIFPFDDMLDNGELRDKSEAAAMVLQSLLSPMDQFQTGEQPKAMRGERLPIVKFHDTIWQRMQKDSSDGVQRRFAKTMADYCKGALMQVEDFSNQTIPTAEEMLKTRILSVGVSPLFALVEYGHGLRIPDYVFEHPAIQEIEQLGIDLALIANDILSYQKEERESMPHNLVAVERMRGLGAQEAFDHIGNMLDSRYERWEKAIDEIPDWGEEVNQEVESYVRGVADVILANLYWSFKSERYLGKDGPVVRKTRRLQVLKYPMFLQNQHLS